ncbi:MAG: ISNCY family transposase [candidate division WOR-3 bacterium]
MESNFNFNCSEMERLRVIERSFAGLSAAKAAAMLNCSPRQVFRLKAKVKKDGPNGIIHGNTGRLPLNAKPLFFRNHIITLYKEEFSDYNIAHFVDTLVEEYGIVLAYETARRWLRAEANGSPKHHYPIHRRQRERRTQFGELLFLDGSPHPWLGLSLPSITLILATDDATGKPLYGLFAPQETLNACFEVLYHVCHKYGLPSALYLDRASHFTTTRQGGIPRFQRDDQLTHFEIALKTLAIEPIFAHSPQARGRGERINGSFQRRLVPELRHHHITTIEPATKYLNEVFIPKYARRFGVKPQSPKPAFRPVPKGIDLRTILCARTTRRVTNDETISYQGTIYQLLPPKRALTLAGITIQIQHWFDNSIHAFYPHLGEIPIQPLSPKNSPQSEEHL